MGMRHRRAAGREWRITRRQALERAGWRCSDCGRAGRLEVHHIRRLADGGEVYAADNLRVLCRDCHIRLHNPENPAIPGYLDWQEFTALLS